MPGYVSSDPLHATILAGTSALQCKGGVIGTNAGAANDTLFLGCYIPLHATTATTLTITGLNDNTGTPQSWVISGSTTVDTSFLLPVGILNDAAAYTFTPSVAGVIVVYTRAFSGGQ
jgi:hypothetical protein